MSPAIHPEEAIDLGYVVAWRLGVQIGVRALAIKGPLLAQQGLRATHQSADVDIWVDPRSWQSYLDHMARSGWRRVETGKSEPILQAHSVAMRHDQWPCEFDVHRMYPGLLREPVECFELAWARRSEALFAGRAVPAVDWATSALIAALHYVRMGRDGVDRLADLQRRLDARSEHERRELDALAVEFGAGQTAAAVISRPSTVEPAVDPGLLADWRLRVSYGHRPAVPFVVSLTRHPLRDWPRLMRHAAWPSTQVLAHRGLIRGEGRSAVLAARLRGWRQGLLALPAALVIALRHRRARSESVAGVGERER